MDTCRMGDRAKIDAAHPFMGLSGVRGRMTLTFTVYNPEDSQEEYSAVCEELGVASQGESVVWAMANVVDATATYLRAVLHVHCGRDDQNPWALIKDTPSG